MKKLKFDCVALNNYKLKSEGKDMKEIRDEPQLPIASFKEETVQLETKNKKTNKKNKKSTSSENEPVKASGSVKEEDISTKTDASLTGTAKKNAAKKKKQREKKAALAAKQSELNLEAPVAPVTTVSSETSNDPQNAIKAKDKKKKAKPAEVNEEKVLKKVS